MKFPRASRGHPKILATTIAFGLIAAGCSASSSSSPSSTKSTPANSGHPDLHGQQLVIDIGSPTPVLSRATSFLAVKLLESWGAKARLVNIGACGKGGELVLTGRAQVTLCPASVALNSGLVAFGSDMPRANYLLVGKRTITSAAALSGRVVGLNNPTGTEATLLPYVVQRYHITGISTVVLGTQPVLLGALASGRIDAGFVLPEQWVALQKKAPSLHLLASAATALPNFAETYLLAKQSWLNSHRSIAVAIDEAWLLSRQTFNQNEARWVAAARSYTAGRYPVVVADATWKQERALGIWPDSNFGFSTALLTYNARAAYSTHAAKRYLAPSEWANQADWTAASSLVFGAHPKGG